MRHCNLDMNHGEEPSRLVVDETMRGSIAGPDRFTFLLYIPVCLFLCQVLHSCYRLEWASWMDCSSHKSLWAGRLPSTSLPSSSTDCPRWQTFTKGGWLFGLVHTASCLTVWGLMESLSLVSSCRQRLLLPDQLSMSGVDYGISNGNVQVKLNGMIKR